MSAADKRYGGLFQALVALAAESPSGPQAAEALGHMLDECIGERLVEAQEDALRPTTIVLLDEREHELTRFTVR